MNARTIAAALLLSLFSIPARAQEQKTEPSAQDFELAKELDAEYSRIVAEEKAPVRAKLAEAKQQIESSKNWEYVKGLETIRKTRSRAAVPLLLEFLITRTYRTQMGRDLGRTLSILTGKSLPDLWGANLDVTTKLARDLRDEWWVAGKESIVTDFDKMSEESLANVIAQLLAMETQADPYKGHAPKPNDGSYVMSLVHRSQRSSYERPMTFDEDLSPRMVTGLLDSAADGTVRYAAVKLIGRIRVQGGAEELDEIVTKRGGDVTTRFAAILALASSGEDLAAKPLLEMLETEKNLDMRLGIIIALSDARDIDKPDVFPKLSEILDGKNRMLRIAALHALAKYASTGAMERIETLLNDTDDFYEAQGCLQLLGGMGTPASKNALGRYLKAALEPSPFHDRILHYALSAFQSAVGQNWTEAGAHDQAYYVECAKQAIEWWEAQKPK